MFPHRAGLRLACLLVLPLTLRAESKGDPPRMLLDDFEGNPVGWTSRSERSAEVGGHHT